MEHIINSKQAENFYSFHKPREFSLDMFCMFWEKTNKPTKKVNTPLPLPQKEKGIKKKKKGNKQTETSNQIVLCCFLPFGMYLAVSTVTHLSCLLGLKQTKPKKTEHNSGNSKDYLNLHYFPDI